LSLAKLAKSKFSKAMETELITIFISMMATHLILLGLSIYAHKKNSNKLFSLSGWAEEMPTLFLLMILGIFLWGIIPFWVWGYQQSIHIIIGQDPPYLHKLSVVFFSGYLAYKIGIKQSEILSLNPPPPFSWQVKPKDYYIHSYVYYRILYLLAYEFWLRGILLFTLLKHLQLVPAIFLNVVLYSLLHLFSNKREFWLCFPFGAYLCLLCWWIGAVWPAMLIHLSLSLSYELNFVLMKRNKYQKI
jgi:hypothetical protein